jgi:hypothetical protein
MVVGAVWFGDHVSSLVSSLLVLTAVALWILAELRGRLRPSRSIRRF